MNSITIGRIAYEFTHSVSLKRKENFFRKFTKSVDRTIQTKKEESWKRNFDALSHSLKTLVAPFLSIKKAFSTLSDLCELLANVTLPLPRCILPAKSHLLWKFHRTLIPRLHFHIFFAMWNLNLHIAAQWILFLLLWFSSEIHDCILTVRGGEEEEGGGWQKSKWKLKSSHC